MVIQIVVFLHVIGAVGLGYYLVLPFFMLRLKGYAQNALQPYMSSIHGTSRIAQYLLILQFLTGGYLISQQDYTVLWMILTIVIFLVIAALSGIMNKRLKQAIGALQEGKSADAFIGTAKTLSIIVSLSMLAVLYVMKFPMYV